MIKDFRQLLALMILFIYSSNFRLHPSVGHIVEYNWWTKYLGVFVFSLVYFWSIEAGNITSRHLFLAIGATGIMTLFIASDGASWKNDHLDLAIG